MKLKWKDGQWIDTATGEPAPDVKRWNFKEPWGGNISQDYEGYQCPITDKWIEGRAAHRENLKKHGCRQLEPGESREANRRIERERTASVDRIFGE